MKICFEDIGCNTGGYLSCQNEGMCLENGNCNCSFGFSGPTCSTCK